MSYVETAWSHASIPADLAGVRPLGDFVLVRMLPEAEMHRNLIWLPQFSGAHADRQLRPVLPSIGEVVAAGPGDLSVLYWCNRCNESHWLLENSSRNCAKCGGSLEVQLDQTGRWCATGKAPLITGRAPMHVKPGDRIMYWRSPANEVILNDETFQFLHEEQHVLGVIEDG